MYLVSDCIPVCAKTWFDFVPWGHEVCHFYAHLKHGIDPKFRIQVNILKNLRTTNLNLCSSPNLPIFLLVPSILAGSISWIHPCFVGTKSRNSLLLSLGTSQLSAPTWWDTRRPARRSIGQHQMRRCRLKCVTSFFVATAWSKFIPKHGMSLGYHGGVRGVSWGYRLSSPGFAGNGLNTKQHGDIMGIKRIWVKMWDSPELASQ